jgi:hypothetical protein
MTENMDLSQGLRSKFSGIGDPDLDQGYGLSIRIRIEVRERGGMD